MKPSPFRGSRELILALALLCLGLGAPFANDAAPTVHLDESLAKWPLCFERNDGQSDPQVKFLARGPGYTAFLTPTEVTLALRECRFPWQDESRPCGARRAPDKTVTRLLRMKLIGANQQPGIVGLDERAAKANYFLSGPSERRTNILTYAKVRYQQVYPGVDAVYYGNQRQLEHDFIVAPGAEPSRIRMEFAGAQKIELDDESNLLIHLGDTEQVQLRKPQAYQDRENGQRTSVAARYRLTDATRVGIQVGPYDPSKPLIIDPVLVWSNWLGGTGADVGNGIAVDANGNVLVTGTTDSPTWASGGSSTTLIGVQNAFVAKLDNDGQPLWSTYLGGTNSDSGNGIAVDSSGNVLVTGTTDSPGWVSGGFNTTLTGARSAFVAKLDSDGQPLWSTYLGGTNSDSGNGIAVDSSGNVLVTGTTDSPGWVSGGFNTTLGGTQNAFVVKLDGGGQFLWSTYLGGTNGDSGNGIAADAQDNVLVTGTTASPGWVSGGSNTTFNTGKGTNYVDAFVVKLNSNGQHLWSTYVGGKYDDGGFGIAADSNGNVFVTGQTDSPGWVSGGFDITHRGGWDGFVAKLSADGQFLWSTYLGRSVNGGTSIAVDGNGNAFVTGTTDSSGWASGGFNKKFHGGSDAFVAKLSSDGRLFWSSYLGGNGADFASAVAVDSNANVFVAGTMYADGWLVGGSNGVYGGGLSDAFVAKISDILDLAGSWTIAPTQKCGHAMNAAPCSLTGRFTVKNTGLAVSQPATVRFVLSNDKVFDPGDTPLGPDVPIKALKVGRTVTVKLNVSLPSGDSASGKYVIAVINSSPPYTVVSGPLR